MRGTILSIGFRVDQGNGGAAAEDETKYKSANPSNNIITFKTKINHLLLLRFSLRSSSSKQTNKQTSSKKTIQIPKCLQLPLVCKKMRKRRWREILNFYVKDFSIKKIKYIVKLTDERGSMSWKISPPLKNLTKLDR